jgi:hypothetical protein
MDITQDHAPITKKVMNAMVVKKKVSSSSSSSSSSSYIIPKTCRFFLVLLCLFSFHPFNNLQE